MLYSRRREALSPAQPSLASCVIQQCTSSLGIIEAVSPCANREPNMGMENTVDALCMVCSWGQTPGVPLLALRGLATVSRSKTGLSLGVQRRETPALFDLVVTQYVSPPLCGGLDQSCPKRTWPWPYGHRVMPVRVRMRPYHPHCCYHGWSVNGRLLGFRMCRLCYLLLSTL